MRHKATMEGAFVNLFPYAQRSGHGQQKFKKKRALEQKLKKKIGLLYICFMRTETGTWANRGPLLSFVLHLFFIFSFFPCILF